MLDKKWIVRIIAWGLSVATTIISLAIWLQALGGRHSISTYKLFPLLGLVAFGLMWGHYIVGSLRRLLGVDKAVLERYFMVTGWIVLIAIVLHPGLLIWQLWRDGFGLPPGSVLENYVSPALRGVTVLGSISLLAFLAFELHHKYRDRSWWCWVERASDVAILLVAYHGLRLGSHLQRGWFQKVWIFYAITLVVSLFYVYYSRIREDKL